MTTPSRRALRRIASAVIAAFALVLVAAGPSRPAAAGTGADQVDARLSATQCSLLGRAQVTPSGAPVRAGQAGLCSRRKCTRPGDTIKPARNAEVCYLGGDRKAPYATFVPASACRSLGRVWIDVVNVCASNPRRSTQLIYHAAQCGQPGRVYLDHTETEGLYDECVTPAEFAVFDAASFASGESVNVVAARMSYQLCRLRPDTVFTGGECRDAGGSPADRVPVGNLVIGDSVTWRAEDELAGQHPDWTVDGMPGRTSAQFADRVQDYLAGHAPPRVIIVALGANPGRHPTLSDYTDAIDLVPDTTRLIFVTPYRAPRSASVSRRRFVEATARAMRVMAATRPHSCVADWARFARTYPAVLIDDVHPTSVGESRWADFVARSWSGCTA